MIKCVIIEDEFAGQDILIEKLERLYPEITIAAVIERKSEAIQFLNNTEVQIVFMDAEIKGGTGISILDHIHFIGFTTIFTTAHEKYAIEAINRGVTYYLLKPFSDDEFVKAVTLGLSKLQEPQANDSINIVTQKGTRRIPIDSINYLKSEGPYTNIHTSKDKFVTTKNLGYYETTLPENRFFRCHNSYLINISKVETLENGRNGSIQLDNNEMIPLSQRRRAEFVKMLEKNSK